MNVGVDGGNHMIKLVTDQGAYKQLSTLGEWRERKLHSSFGPDDIEFEYRGQKGFAGSLAKYESEFIREMKGDSKAHEDAQLRILIALHRFTNSHEFNLVVGQPINQHTDEEKRAIKNMLSGEHTIKVNGITKTFHINKVEVGAEGAAAYFANDIPDSLVRIVDIGSGTINLATVIDGNFIDRESDTLMFGSNTNKTNNLEAMSQSIISHTSTKWKKNDRVLVVGGLAEQLKPYIQKHYQQSECIKPKIYTNRGAQLVSPVFANAVGFYHLARVIYGG